ncbi:hypothetical protein Tco_0755598 [Tanacetum coccineum]
MAALMYKDDHNKIAYLGRERGCEDFTDILSYLDHSPLRYVLTHDPPVVFDSLVKQFWATAVVRPNAAGSHDLVATIDGREVVVTESLIRTQLQFDDANGIFDMPNNDILEEFWRTQDEWIVSSWKLYPKSSVHVLDLTNGKTVYMFVDKFYPIRATLLECMLHHRLIVPPSYCRDVVVAGSVIQTVQTGLRQSI